jgi:5'-methylthioadenosine phosphorylase
MAQAELAIIGGSGFYQMEGLSDRQEVRCRTPFGDPSDAVVLGTLGGRRVAFLPRHGMGHRLLPGEVPSQANIYALKTLGVERIVAINTVGSLRKQIAPRDLAVPDQLIDQTRGRAGTFFGRGLVAHISFADPFCPVLRQVLLECAREAGATVHDGGTCVVMEGPPFSTRAESNVYRFWGADLVGMTALPEAKLAREAEICYASLCCVTDYDVWHESYGTVSAEMILANLALNSKTAEKVVALTAQGLPRGRDCACGGALSDALVTPPHLVPAEIKKELAPIVGKYMPSGGDGGKDG